MSDVSAQCEIVELRFPTDVVGYACTRSATQHFDDCGSSLCSFQAAAVLFVLDAVSQNQRGISISTRCLQAVV